MPLRVEKLILKKMISEDKYNLISYVKLKMGVMALFGLEFTPIDLDISKYSYFHRPTTGLSVDIPNTYTRSMTTPSHAPLPL
jgi:hypothetical protein